MRVEVGKKYEAIKQSRSVNVGDIATVEEVNDNWIGFTIQGEPNGFAWSPSIFENSFEESVLASDKPAHYGAGIDTIAFAKENCPPEQVEGFYRINALKYIQRYDKKNGTEDVRKAITYLQMLLEHLEGDKG